MLPEKPSELLRVALADLQLCEADSNFRVYMPYWFRANGSGEVCDVCLAGSVMAKSLTAVPTEHHWPEHFGEDNGKKLYALNYLREGLIVYAIRLLDFPVSILADFVLPLEMGQPNILEERHYINEDAKDLPRFYSDMYALAQELEKVGL